MTINPRHPIQEFSAAVMGSPNDDLAHQLSTLIKEIGEARNWTLGEPEVTNFVTPGEPESANLGVLLQIYSGLPPWGARLPPAIDRAHFEEVSSLVEALCRFSIGVHREIECYLDDVYVGSIEGGRPDRLIREGLLSEWEAQLRRT